MFPRTLDKISDFRGVSSHADEMRSENSLAGVSLRHPVLFGVTIPQVVQLCPPHPALVQHLDALYGGRVPATQCLPSAVDRVRSSGNNPDSIASDPGLLPQADENTALAETPISFALYPPYLLTIMTSP